MKKIIWIFFMMLFLVFSENVMAQEMLVGDNVLPQLQAGLPDPGVVLGAVGSLYQDNYPYYETIYDTYLYPRPDQPQTFADAYTAAATGAGYTSVPDVVDGNPVLRISSSTGQAGSALLFYDYQGYVLFMVPAGMTFTLNGEDSGSDDPAYLVELGYEAIQNEDYEQAIRYLIRAASSYVKTPETSENNMIVNEYAPTPEPTGPRTYTVQDGDTCWGIAVDRFGVNFELFMQVNGMVECNIGIGDEVIIPGADQQMATPTPIPLDQYTMGQVISYVVEMNDSYNEIANKFNTTLDSIQRLNNVNVYTGFPQYGQTLQIEVNLNTPTPTPEATETPVPGTLAP